MQSLTPCNPCSKILFIHRSFFQLRTVKMASAAKSCLSQQDSTSIVAVGGQVEFFKIAPMPGGSGNIFSAYGDNRLSLCF
ncbi:hypothetical protein AAKU67_002810 [Oxalobacteraceae bacterium GrIS 2.11]